MNPQTKLVFSTLALFVCFAATRLPAAQDLYHLLRTVETEHPSCDNPLDLTVAGDYFGPVANDVDGVQDYNRLTSFLRDHQWSQLESGITQFMATYESSPLREATAFLGVYARFLRVGSIDSGEYREAEKMFSEARLLYPKSALIPVILADNASRHLKEGLFEKSLALYKTAREQYPFHELSCVFQAGVAETSLLLRDFTGAERSYQQLLQKCKNTRLRIAADLRLAELKERKSKVDSTTVMEKIFSDSPKLVLRYYPTILYNLGEKKFSRGQYPSAKFFFNEYLKADQPFACKAYAAKRLADIVLRTTEDRKEVIGKYLEVKETYPATDPGRFSHIHGMLLGLEKVSEPEQVRRLRVIDEEIDLIDNKKLREVMYLEKALALLDGGEEGAIRSLIKVKENSTQDLTKEPVASFIRGRVVDLLTEELNNPPPKNVADYGKFAAAQLDLYESVLHTWLAGKPEEKRAMALVRGRLLKLAEMALDADLPDLSLELLERGKKLSLLPSDGTKFADAAFRQKYAEKFLTRLIQSPNKKALAEWFMKNHERVTPYVEPASRLLWISSAVETGEDAAIIRTVKMVGQDRRPAAALAPMSPLLKDYYHFNEGKALALLKRWGDADSRLANVSTETFRPKAEELRLNIALEQKQYAKAYQLGFALLDKKTGPDRTALLETMRQLCYDGKLWSKVDPFMTKVRKLSLPDDKIAPFQYLAGKAYWETKQCPKAVESFEVALVKSPLAPESSEARYLLGKCYSQLRKPSQAKKIWTELLNSQDAFWSKMARNELNLSK